jgi:PST family polysaccharide transporter/lipopolysaccharide exporter
MIFPLKNLTARIHSVLYPVLSKLKDNASSLEQTYSRVVEGLAYLAFPISVLISVLAPIWVPVVFDVSVYDQLIPLVQILSIVGAAQAITSPVMSLYLIAGRTRALFVVGIVVALVNGVSFLVGGMSGSIQYFAVVYAIVQLTISIPVSNFVPYRLLSFNFIRFMKGLSVPLVASVILYGSIYFSSKAGSDFPVVLQLILAVLLGLIIYAICLALLAGPQLKTMYSMFRSILNRG